MKKIIFVFAVVIAIAACSNKQAATPTSEGNVERSEVPFEVTAFDQVEDGSRYLLTAKKIFGDKYDAFQAINSDEKNRERLRAEGLATYAKKNGLAVTLYQDYGWPAKKLGD